MRDAKKTYHSIIVCPECKGYGVILKRKFKGHTEGWISESETCHVCKGKRVLKRKVTIELFTI